MTISEQRHVLRRFHKITECRIQELPFILLHPISDISACQSNLHCKDLREIYTGYQYFNITEFYVSNGAIGTDFFP